MTPWRNSSPQGVAIPVRRGRIDVLYTGNKAQLRHLRTVVQDWKQWVENPAPSQRDSLRLAKYAIRRWKAAHDFYQTAISVQRLKQMVRDNPRIEVSVLAVARAAWNRRIVGVCNFRRTWCNNIALDAVATHSRLDEMENSPIHGLGSGFLHHVCCVGEEIGASAIWGECTQNSKEFYINFVDWREADDLMVVPQENYIQLKRTIEEKWASRRRAEQV